jgi:glycosyltransferase involved in cell wall biosynthesis
MLSDRLPANRAARKPCRVTDSFAAAAQSEAEAGPGTGDVIEDIIAARRPDPMIGARDALSVRREASDLLRAARNDGTFAASLPRALALVAGFPDDEHCQRIVAYLLEGMGDLRGSQRAWRGISARFPQSVEAFAQTFRMAAKVLGRDAAESLFRRRFGDWRAIAAPERLLMAALALQTLGHGADAEAACRKAIAMRPDDAEGWHRLVALLDERELLPAARDAAAEGLARTADPGLAAEQERLTRDCDRLHADFPTLDFARTPVWKAVLDDTLASAVAARRADPPRAAPGQIGGIVMIGGTLGGGGAERQLVTSAIALDDAARAGTEIGGRRLTGPVQVLCRKLDPRRGQDFFLPLLASQGIAVTSYLAAPRFGGRPARSALAGQKAAIARLPVRTREGIEHLVDLLRYHAPDVVHIWQDGMILAAGMAALLARVPRIVLNVRTLPPTERADRMKPESEAIYRALLAAPGVTLTANSALAARRYEAWLRLPQGSASVVPNGVSPLSPAPAEEDVARWEGFAARTGGGFTVGGVMRFDANKRPIDWLAIADRLIALRPDARFILVGDGELRGPAREYAARLGIADRVLFVGRSPRVGYWLSRMDAFLLTSRFEGTPNVLIEAQLAGLPVVTTPAGAAGETILPGVTGHVLADGETIDVDRAAALLEAFAAESEASRQHLSTLARARAEQHFSVATMLRHTLEVFAAPDDAPLLDLTART